MSKSLPNSFTGKIATISDMKKQPKFSIGNKVFCKPTLYGETEGVITDVDRYYTEVDEENNFVRGGLSHFEHNLNNISLPWKFDGYTLEIYYTPDPHLYINGKTKKSKFKGYVYTVKSEKMNTLFEEKSLKLKG